MKNATVRLKQKTEQHAPPDQLKVLTSNHHHKKIVAPSITKLWQTCAVNTSHQIKHIYFLCFLWVNATHNSFEAS